MSEINIHPDCKTKIYLANNIDKALALNPSKIIENAGILVIDNIDWKFNFNKIQKGLKNRTFREYDSKFVDKNLDIEIVNELRKGQQEVFDIFKQLFPNYKYKDRGKYSLGLRNMITGPEPMHFDTKPYDQLILTSYINLDTQPRIYKISYTFKYLIETYPRWMKKLKALNKNIPREMREITIKNKGRLTNKSPKHIAIFSPKTLWFFDPQLIAHEVIFGRGTMAQTWFVTNFGKDFLTQKQLLDTI